jgi:hypothetical protein
MKEKLVYGVAHVTGYTSEAEIELFYKHSDALDRFHGLKENTLMEYIRLSGWEEDILDLPSEKLESDYGITIDDQYDITWDSFEVYERIYIIKLKIK